jgi:hypothetical protein
MKGYAFSPRANGGSLNISLSSPAPPFGFSIGTHALSDTQFNRQSWVFPGFPLGDHLARRYRQERLPADSGRVINALFLLIFCTEGFPELHYSSSMAARRRQGHSEPHPDFFFQSLYCRDRRGRGPVTFTYALISPLVFTQLPQLIGSTPCQLWYVINV